MLHIKLIKAQPANDPTDPLPRRYFGWDEKRSIMDNWNANRGYWALGARADRQPFVLCSFAETGMVVMAARIDRIIDAAGKPGRRIIEGEPLSNDHPVWKAYVGNPTPPHSLAARNPITYLDDDRPGFGRRCGCGCGAEVYEGLFVPGHDQTALHKRVAKIGTIQDFMNWFDRTYESKPRRIGQGPMTVSHYGRLDLTTHRDGRVEVLFIPDGKP